MSQPNDASSAVSGRGAGAGAGADPGAGPAGAGEVSGDEVKQLLRDPGLPEAVRRALLGGAKLERIELDPEGQWRHQGEPFTNPNLIALFHRSIARTAGGTYVLQIPPFSYPITVADTPRFVRHVRIAAREAGGREAGGPAVTLLLSDGSEQPLAADGLAYVADRGLYCRVLSPDGSRWPARFLRPAYYALAEHLVEEGGAFQLDLPSGRVPIPTVEHAAAVAV
ncbi:MAG: DUF1285 domain-containing protein [Polyangia bacterium]